MSEKPRQFTCIDCGEPVVSYGVFHANDQSICVTCMWIRDTLAKIEDPGERERTRNTLRRFHERGDP